jgi:hypothetical protein
VSNDFLPAVVSAAILLGCFLFAWISDVRRIQRLTAPEHVETIPSEIGSAGVESLPVLAE